MKLTPRARALASSLMVLAALAATARAAPPRGTALDDRLVGTSGPDSIRGAGGDDVLIGHGGRDALRGGAGDDSVRGMGGNDVLRGDGGSDRLLGGAGRDTLSGGAGADTLVGDADADRLLGGPGPDLIRARRGGRDRIDCGPGRDRAILDSRDVAVGCEVVRRPRPPAPASTRPEKPRPAPAPLTTSPVSRPAAGPSAPSADPPPDPPPPPLLPDDYPQLLAAGDIADCTPPAEQTAALLDGLRGTVTPLGDVAYPSGSYEEFTNCYEPTWGRHKHRTRPTVGSHEYDTPGAEPYWDYFGDTAGEPGKGWYSYDIGSWHVVVLNSACDEVGGCHDGSPQYEWLRGDLEESPSLCTAAYWHIPRFSSGKRHGSDLNYVAFWEVLYEHGVEFVMGGNDHHYERFAPQTPYGDLDLTDGVRQFVVGTGGRFLREMSDTPGPNFETGDDTTHGILRVGLLEDSYEWEFLPVAGGLYTDSGSTACH